MTRDRIDNKEFVRVWTLSETLEDVARRMKITKRQATLKASALRARQVVLKKFGTGVGSTDTRDLNAVVARAMRGSKS